MRKTEKRAKQRISRDMLMMAVMTRPETLVVVVMAKILWKDERSRELGERKIYIYIWELNEGRKE